MKKTLRIITLAGALAVGLSACYPTESEACRKERELNQDLRALEAQGNQAAFIGIDATEDRMREMGC